MTVRITPEQLRGMAATWSGVLHVELVDTCNRATGDLMVNGPVNVSELLRTYQVRLNRWETNGLPPASGMREFVDALSIYDGKLALVASMSDQDRTFVLVIDAPVERFVAVMSVAGH